MTAPGSLAEAPASGQSIGHPRTVTDTVPA